MDLPAVEGVLNDLPNTFRRDAAPYTQFIDALSNELVSYTLGADAAELQVQTFADLPQDGWLDVWGLLWGVPRPPNEANILYAARIQNVILAWFCTLPAIQAWINLYAPGSTVTERTGLGYDIFFAADMTQAQIQDFLISFNRIRPAGVPFNIYQIGSGLFLDTDAFLESGSRIAGDYLTTGTHVIPLPLGAVTLNMKPLLPDLMLGVDPTIGQLLPFPMPNPAFT